MRKVYVISLLLIFGMVLIGCGTTDDQPEDMNEGIPNEQEEKEVPENNTDDQDPNGDAEEEEETSELILDTGASETVERAIEGMEEEVEVINYHIQPYDISYQLDASFGVPEVDAKQITYRSGEAKVMFEVIEQTSLDEAVANLQEQYEEAGYNEAFELEDTPAAENDLQGKMQVFGYPIQGFHVYEVDEHVFVITYEYPAEYGDGMGPTLQSLRESITYQN